MSVPELPRRREVPHEHKLKTWPEEFAAVAYRGKRVELRRNDRDFQEGDILILQEWAPGEEQGVYYGAAADPGFRGYSGAECRVRVSHVFWPRYGLACGLMNGYVAMSIELLDD